LLLGLILSFGLHFIVPIIKFIPSPYRYLGIIFLIIGSWITVWADNIFKKEKTAVKPFEKSTSLVIYEPYKLSRHPMYLGMLLLLLGIGIILGSLAAFI